MMNGPGSLSGFQTEALIREIEINFWDTWSNFGCGPGCTLHDEGDALWFETPIPIIPYNVILKFQVERNIDQRIEDLVNHFTLRKVPLLWIVHPTSKPLDLSCRLQKRGLLHIEIAPCMARGLADMPQVPPLPDGVEVREVIEESDVIEFQELTVWRWGVPQDHCQQLQAIVERFRVGKPGSKTRMWLAWHDGFPISKLATYYGEGSVGIYGVVTKTEERGQGLASFLIIEAMKAAREAGQKLAVLHSSPLAENLYKRLGFHTVTQFHLFASEPAYL